MHELFYTIKKQAAAYPQMEEQDAIKLIFQNEFGCGHMVNDEKDTLKMLENELFPISSNKNVCTFESIGNSYSRMNLKSPAAFELGAEIVNRLFVFASRRGGGARKSFEEKFKVILHAAEEGVFAFSSEQLKDYWNGYSAAGFPLVSHSEKYRELYAPAYRVVESACVPLPEVLLHLKKLSAGCEAPIVAIDGGAASGKSTAAEILKFVFDANLIHMDDFFLPPPLRTAERFSVPGGNIHHERFRAEVAEKLNASLSGSYRPFDCSTLEFGNAIPFESGKMTIVEGVYSHSPDLHLNCDLKIFFSVDDELQQKRLFERSGRELYKKFTELWLPLERKYFEHFKIEKGSDLTVIQK